jgi:hypothetical protein
MGAGSRNPSCGLRTPVVVFSVVTGPEWEPFERLRSAFSIGSKSISSGPLGADDLPTFITNSLGEM